MTTGVRRLETRSYKEGPRKWDYLAWREENTDLLHLFKLLSCTEAARKGGDVISNQLLTLFSRAVQFIRRRKFPINKRDEMTAVVYTTGGDIADGIRVLVAGQTP